jgi:2-polyprenyl-6-methoxyphenol hydroxylase-like FAD-dependent oxidoreductase
MADMKTPVAIIGGGPSAAASAMFLKTYGIDSVIVEKDAFPRFHIGESMSGECGAIVRQLGLEEEMLKRKFPVKRGLTVYGTGGKNAWYIPVMGRDDEWKLFPQTTWQVRRSEFDKLMLDTAVERRSCATTARCAASRSEWRMAARSTSNRRWCSIVRANRPSSPITASPDRNIAAIMTNRSPSFHRSPARSATTRPSTTR